MKRADQSPSQEQRVRKSSGLWADIEPYVNHLMLVPGEDLPFLHERNTPSSPSMVTPNGFPSPEIVMPPPEPLDGDQSGRGYMPDMAADILSGMEEIKNRYIVGKTVGRDLWDAKGDRLASQGERITRQLVRAADAAGLLVELIEYMNYDSFEE